MPYVIETRHRLGSNDIRQKIRPEHLEYLDKHVDKLLAAGAKLEDDGSPGMGSFYIFATEDRGVAEAFMNAEPYVLSGICEAVEYTRWRKGYFDFSRASAT